MSRLLIVSNRLPISVQMQEGEFSYVPSAGGLATGLKSLHEEGDTLWLGWPGYTFTPEEDTSEVTQKLQSDNMYPVYITAEDYEDFYEGFSNKTIWPLFHYFQQFTNYNTKYWEVYKKVNQQFCDELLKIVEPGDRIWVHDYQLMLLPQMIREQQPDATIGFFLHIPYPSYEVFRTLPWRKEILLGMLGSDFIAFHTYDYVRHFLSGVSRILGLEHSLGRIRLNDRIIEVDSMPMGIDYKKFENAVREPETISEVVKFSQQFGQQKLILSIDRLDYTKGILQRLEAFEQFLTKYPEYHNKVSLIVVLVPSRAGVDQYQALKVQIDEIVGRVNGGHNTVDWRPIHYFYRALDFNTLSALYYLAEIALVTPFRDGMNLVAKEYLASKIDKKGVLILSEMAGAAKELSGAVMVNPNDVTSIVDAIYTALNMPVEEQKQRNEAMQEVLSYHTVGHWAQKFIDHLDETRQKVLKLREKYFSPAIEKQIQTSYSSARNRLLLLDYDGTLVNFKGDPLQAVPNENLLHLIEQLAADPHNTVVIISGRNRDFLEKWFGKLPIKLIAEHGVWRKDQQWVKSVELDDTWKAEIKQLLDIFVDRTMGSFVEHKDYSLAWHYRKCDSELGNIRSRELMARLAKIVALHQLQILEGSKVIEVKNQSINKGKAIIDLIEKVTYDFILAIGDDHTDEDIFKTLDKESYTLKVGYKETAARFHIRAVEEVREFLNGLLKIGKDSLLGEAAEKQEPKPIKKAESEKIVE